MLNIWSITDIGLVRKENQDAFATSYHEESGRTIAVVCDGMGGSAGGRIASKLAVETYIQEVSLVLTAQMEPEQIREASSYAISKANKAIADAAARNEEIANMGTTLVAAISCQDGVVVSNVGDSRAYCISTSGIHRITKDHSLVETMVEHGDITADEARHHPNKNLITRALGANCNATCDGYIYPMHKGDYLLLCTDGLVDTVTDQELLFEIIHMNDPSTSLNRLLKISKSNGAPDNVTAVLMQIS
ncbi:MAG: Stp1/IreP family PP2C-type Ser/Thr phosphatase [Oscillibacter sp.]|nr:Stp1/IreP family PP2C-type Ser/Thr phosphatase [Oscillibacter sp.]